MITKTMITKSTMITKLRPPTGSTCRGDLTPDEETTMIADRFDSRTLANMEVALERACKILSIGADEDSVRRHIASRILETQSG